MPVSVFESWNKVKGSTNLVCTLDWPFVQQSEEKYQVITMIPSCTMKINNITESNCRNCLKSRIHWWYRHNEQKICCNGIELLLTNFCMRTIHRMLQHVILSSEYLPLSTSHFAYITQGQNNIHVCFVFHSKN